jgi:hypothetical protein
VARQQFSAAEQRQQQFAEYRHHREQEAQQQREQVITEFGGDPHAMVAEILSYRRGFVQLAEAIELMRQGGPFAIAGPGPYWKPRARWDKPMD